MEILSVLRRQINLRVIASLSCFFIEIVQAAQAMGIVKATVSGLLPGTDYYVKFAIEMG
jgi:hypothetical protein